MPSGLKPTHQNLKFPHQRRSVKLLPRGFVTKGICDEGIFAKGISANL
jgi:hypothetical protein